MLQFARFKLASAVGNAKNRLLRAQWDKYFNDVESYINNGGCPNAQNEDGKTPLMAVADGGNARLVKLLLEKGASVDVKDKDGMTALMYAARRDAECVGELQFPLYKADPFARDNNGMTAFDHAKKAGNREAQNLIAAAMAKRILDWVWDYFHWNLYECSGRNPKVLESTFSYRIHDS